MLYKLQRKTLIPIQLTGYIVTLLVGVSIVLLAVQAYYDLRPVLTEQTGVFKAHTVTVSKNITIYKTVNKKNIYFDNKELKKIEQQPFIKNIACFNTATFNAKAAIRFEGQSMITDLFFESVPDEYLDVQSTEWQWDSTSGFLPVIIPEDYLNLYNFGFAESQSLPVISKNLLSQVTFNIIVEGNGKRKIYNSRIIGLSGKINSILVPDKFLKWANVEFGTQSTTSESHPSRLLLEFTDANDERIPHFIETNGLNINKAELEANKIVSLLRFVLIFVLVIAAIVITLSVSFIIMSFNLIIQKNRKLFVNLYQIGYTTSQIAKYYKWVISIITALDIIIAALLASFTRSIYLKKLTNIFEIDSNLIPVTISASVLIITILVTYSHIIHRIVSHTVKAD